MAGTNARHAARTRKAARRAASVRHISTPKIAISKTKSTVLWGSSIQASGSGTRKEPHAAVRAPARGTPRTSPRMDRSCLYGARAAPSDTSGSAVLVPHLRDTLGYRARRAQPHVRLPDPPAQHGPAVAHALVVGMSRAALAPACAPVSGQRGAPGLDRGPDRRVDFVHRVGGRGRHLLSPLPQRGRGGLPRRGELLVRVACVISHIRIFSPRGRHGQPGSQKLAGPARVTVAGLPAPARLRPSWGVTPV